MPRSSAPCVNFVQRSECVTRRFPLLTVGVFGRMAALDGIRMPDGCYADGTWELKMHVTDLHRDVSLRVTGEIHIGGVMLKLVEKLGMHMCRCHTGAGTVRDGGGLARV